MTIDEAMAELSLQLEVKRRMGNNRQADAIKLGIEALKRVERDRQLKRNPLLPLLPGETE